MAAGSIILSCELQSPALLDVLKAPSLAAALGCWVACR